jgi:hypothetical protein
MVDDVRFSQQKQTKPKKQYLADTTHPRRLFDQRETNSSNIG